ncbi:MAG: response regulator [Ignavibacteriales bacterium]|nr:MAG: response regulator [Ignavibacteriales bacterium]
MMTENRYDVLIAEDEAVIALEIKQVLSRNNYNVVGIVRSGEDLIKASAEKNPDIIVSDISLKGNLNGIDAAKAIHKLKDIPVIFVTGYGDMATYLRALKVSPIDYLLKPFSERRLINAVNGSIGHIHHS